MDVEIRLEKLNKTLRGKRVLRDLDLEVRRGETLVVIGRSGTGKSVLLKHIIGLAAADSGRLFVREKDVTDPNGPNREAIRGLFGMVFQDAALLASLSIADNVGLGLRENRLYPEAEIERIVAEKLEMVGLKEAAQALPAQLSGGMRKRAGLARALAMNPEIILYDEPTAGLDPIMSDNVDSVIKEMKGRLRMTSIVVTHDMISAFGIADRIAMLHEGSVVEMGAPDEIRESRNPVVQEFIAREGALIRSSRQKEVRT